MNAHVRALVERAVRRPTAATPVLRPRVGHDFDGIGRGGEDASAGAGDARTAYAEADSPGAQPFGDPAGTMDTPSPPGASDADRPRPAAASERSDAQAAAWPEVRGTLKSAATHASDEAAARGVAREWPTAGRPAPPGVDRVFVASTDATAEPATAAPPSPTAEPRPPQAAGDPVAGRRQAVARTEAGAILRAERSFESAAPAAHPEAGAPPVAGDRLPPAAAQPAVTGHPHPPRRRAAPAPKDGNAASYDPPARAPAAPPRRAREGAREPSPPGRDRAVDEEAERVASRHVRARPARDVGQTTPPLIPREASRDVRERSPDGADGAIEIHIGHLELRPARPPASPAPRQRARFGDRHPASDVLARNHVRRSWW